VPDAAASAHALRQAGVDHARVAERVGMLQLTVEHPGHDLHVAVRVRAETSIGLHDVIVTDEQQPVVGVAGVVVVAK